MDIDEFLEKELQAMEKEETGKKPVVANIPAEKQVPIDVSKEEQYIKHFFDLWSKVAETKFKWDNNLYTEIGKSAEKVKEQLNSVLIALAKEKKDIKNLIGMALSEIENKNYEAATKLYSEISDRRNKFPDFLLEEKKDFNREIFMLFGKLHDQIGLKFIEDFKVSIAKVGEYIKDSMSSLDAGDIEKAKVIYEKALETYKDLPNGFLQQKMELGSELLKLYKDLSIQIQITELQQQLSRPSIVYNALGSDNRLAQLAEIINHKRALTDAYLPQRLRDVSLQQNTQDKSLLSQLIGRKLERARTNIGKELYPEAKRNIDAILRVDPGNIEAKQLLRRIPINA